MQAKMRSTSVPRKRELDMKEWRLSFASLQVSLSRCTVIRTEPRMREVETEHSVLCIFTFLYHFVFILLQLELPHPCSSQSPHTGPQPSPLHTRSSSPLPIRQPSLCMSQVCWWHLSESMCSAHAGLMSCIVSPRHIGTDRGKDTEVHRHTHTHQQHFPAQVRRFKRPKMALIDVTPLFTKFLGDADSKALRGASRVMAEDPRSLPERLLEMTRRANATRHRAVIAEGRFDEVAQWHLAAERRASDMQRRAMALLDELEAGRGV